MTDHLISSSYFSLFSVFVVFETAERNAGALIEHLF